MTLQVPSIILPNLLTRIQIVGTETETVADALEHTSVEFPVDFLQEKLVHVMATEVVAFGAPGVLNCWIELSPVLSTASAIYWGAIGGGGGAIAPVAPVTEVGAGVNARVHNLFIPWTMHSPYARLVVQVPIPSATAFWLVQGFIVGKG